MSTVLSTDKSLRKSQPMARGLLDYFPRALAAVSNVSFVANEQHNPGEEMHWAKEKSTDHADCIIRHMVDRGRVDDDGLRHSAKLAWRALALLETEIEGEEQMGSFIASVPTFTGIDPAVAAYTEKAQEVYGPNLEVPFADEITLLGPNERLALPFEPESTKPFDLPVLRPDQTVNERGEIVDLDAMFPSNDSNDRPLRDENDNLIEPFATQLPASDFDADACGTTDGTTPIEYRVNYARQATGTTNSNVDKSHWIVRGDVIRFFDLDVGTETDEVGGLELCEIRHGLLSGSFVLCDEYGTALPPALPIEYRVNYPNDGQSHWIVRGDAVFFVAGREEEESPRSVASIEAGLRDGTFIHCDRNGEAL